MPEEQIPNGATPQGTETTVVTTETPPTGETPKTVEQLLALIADREAALKSTRSESIDRRKKLDAFERSAAEAAAATLSDIDKATKRADAAEATATAYRDRIASQEVRLRAIEKGFADPTDAMDMLRSTLQYDDDGMPKDLDDALDALLKAKPYLRKPEAAAAKAAAPSSGGATNPSKSTTSQAQALTWDLIKTMTAAQYDERRSEIYAYIQKNQPPRK